MFFRSFCVFSCENPGTKVGNIVFRCANLFIFFYMTSRTFGEYVKRRDINDPWIICEVQKIYISKDSDRYIILVFICKIITEYELFYIYLTKKYKLLIKIFSKDSLFFFHPVIENICLPSVDCLLLLNLSIVV